jgi:hypothetical protein
MQNGTHYLLFQICAWVAQSERWQIMGSTTGVRFQAEAAIFLLVDNLFIWLWGSPSLVLSGYREFFSGGKATGPWIYSLMNNVEWLIVMGWDWLRTVVTNGPTVHPSGDTWAWRAMMMMIPAGITPDSSTRALWQSYQQRHLGKVRGMDEGMRIQRIQYLRYINRFLTCRKIFRHGTFRLYFQSEGRCAAGFYHP